MIHRPNGAAPELSYCGKAGQVTTPNLDEVTCRVCHKGLPEADMNVRRREEYQALVKLRELYRDEFDASRTPSEVRRGGDYYRKLHELKKNHRVDYERFRAAEVGNHDEATKPRTVNMSMVPTGKATCYRCGGVLVEHKIGQCRPEAYSLWAR
jgi:hypothetical protein